jgi:unsaturated pyranuronate lyase
MTPEFVSFDQVKRFRMADGVSGRPLFGADAMLNLVDLEPNAVVALHSHPHEQLGVVLSGEMTLLVNGTEHLLRAMDAYTVPGAIEHEGRAGPDGALVLDVFQPPREDYRLAWEAAPDAIASDATS